MASPSVTLIICSYNQAAYIKESVEAVLKQTYSPIEIIISDDCSTDSTFQIIEQTVAQYTGPNEIVLNRNDINLGLIEHVNKVFRMAKGDLIIGSAGDDVCLPERIATMVDLYKKRNGKPTLFHGDVIKIDKNSNELGVLEASWGTNSVDLSDTAVRGSLYIGASSAFTRSLLDAFPPIHYKNAYEDLVWGFRAALLDAVVYVDTPLVKYRVGVGISWTSNHKTNKTLNELLDQKKSKRRVFIDVYSQRLLDLEYVDPNKTYKCLRKKIQRKKLKHEIDFLLIDNPRQAIQHGWNSPILLLSRYFALRKVKARFTG